MNTLLRALWGTFPYVLKTKPAMGDEINDRDALDDLPESIQSSTKVIMKNIYVSNLSYTTDNQQLKALFSPFGGVMSASIIMDRDTGRSKGFGFVEMENEGDAAAAIIALNGKVIEGRPLKVNEAKPREQSRTTTGGRYGRGLPGSSPVR